MTEAHVRRLLEVYGDERASAATLLCDRHPADAVAFTVVEPDLTGHDLTYGELRERSERFAGALAGLGVGPGDRVATLMGKSAELVVALLAIWRLGAVHVPLFTAFAPPAIALRITGNGTKAVIADADQLAKLEPSADLPADDGRRIVVVGDAAGGALSFGELEAGAAPWPDAAVTGGSGVLVELFTSGTTGTPKAVPIPLRALAGFQAYQDFALDVRDDDVFWNAADPGWAYGLYYAIMTPMATGRRSLLLHAGFSAELTWAVLEKFGVTNFAAAPTVYRALRNADAPVPDGLRLRHCSSAGEPLTPDVLEWASSKLGVGVHDHYGQTELGMVVGNAWHPELRAEIKPGSMGRVLPGFAVEVLREDADVVVEPGERGRVALDLPASPLLWFRGYRDAPERTAARFSPDGRWYYTGDVAAKDADGYLTFASRDDDVILMAGYRIGPFDVESVLQQHSAVAESAVIGVPDALRGEVVVAYVVVRDGVTADAELADELRRLVKTRFAAHAYPREVHFVGELPKTPSGKIQRFLLRKRHAS
ncbi:AMP-dependent synthetase [Amycolatopsis orientalis]|uniref:AMP-dependent synthetase n=1 Tax=Amycolatopsis orientalis TaxID=31958 RepID=A0A193C110_AMYOR|nr:AMP-binding protein [Amycolatopsis orientalis]ANN18095.1 AMP-dependent synthetase [Amycolatopsis orientalis]